MGPEGGSGGGTVVATGTPEEVAAMPGSHTGRFLRDILARRPPGPGKTRKPRAKVSA
jgi:excinuclease ABC subunit A